MKYAGAYNHREHSVDDFTGGQLSTVADDRSQRQTLTKPSDDLGRSYDGVNCISAGDDRGNAIMGRLIMWIRNTLRPKVDAEYTRVRDKADEHRNSNLEFQTVLESVRLKRGKRNAGNDND